MKKIFIYFNKGLYLCYKHIFSKSHIRNKIKLLMTAGQNHFVAKTWAKFYKNNIANFEKNHILCFFLWQLPPIFFLSNKFY